MLKHNPVEVSLSPDQPVQVLSDGVYRWGLVYHCGAMLGWEQKNDPDTGFAELVIEYRECPDCHKNIAMAKPTFSCGHDYPNGNRCSYRSQSRQSVEYHIVRDHTEHCPVCKSLIGSGAGGKGCSCPTT